MILETKVNALLDKVRPYIQMHGGDVRLLRMEDTVVVIKIDGACVHCSLAHMTYNTMVGPLLQKEIPEITEVIFEA